MNEEKKKAAEEGLSAAAKKVKKQQEERAKTAKEKAKDLAFEQFKAASMASRKKKTSSEFRNGGVVDLGDFKGSF
tara:strand:+ start:2006 stop:2230 length:225 start_codon:yes stop_codon:yes gene_type:complete